ncbi:hypothetical protein SBA3_1230002 [Candidatus Sulfopaludibacter sp. SbA3]|nr:hypothetical protein SBA3_1230002 [Candidatus Sulfopaludibacter sp. SbA3]
MSLERSLLDSSAAQTLEHLIALASVPKILLEWRLPVLPAQAQTPEDQTALASARQVAVDCNLPTLSAGRLKVLRRLEFAWWPARQFVT